MKRVALLAMLAIAAAAAFAPATSARGKANTTVTLDDVFAVPVETHWDGDVRSQRKACKNRRQVLVFRVRPGADAKVGSTKSYRGKADPGYYWSYVEQGVAPVGDYYAKVKPTDTCQGDRSKALHFSGPL